MELEISRELIIKQVLEQVFCLKAFARGLVLYSHIATGSVSIDSFSKNDRDNIKNIDPNLNNLFRV